MDPLSNPAVLIFSAVLPLLIAFVKQAGWSSQVNALVALICYVVVGVAAVFFSGEELTVENAVAIITVVTTVGTVAYNLFWKNFGDERINEATSFVK